jgi:hypothetical protein
LFIAFVSTSLPLAGLPLIRLIRPWGRRPVARLGYQTFLRVLGSTPVFCHSNFPWSGVAEPCAAVFAAQVGRSVARPGKIRPLRPSLLPTPIRSQGAVIAPAGPAPLRFSRPIAVQNDSATRASPGALAISWTHFLEPGITASAPPPPPERNLAF